MNISQESIQKKEHVLLKIVRSTLALALFLTGLYLLSQNVIIPVFVSYAYEEQKDPIINPLQKVTLSVLPNQASSNGFTFNELESQAKKHKELTSYDDNSNIPILTKDESDAETTNYDVPHSYFYLTIPKLDIVDALVEIDSGTMDPQDSIGHFKGSCLPGEGCNSFIYGHSTYSYFKNHYKEGDYTAIFSKLEDLDYGDEFTIKYKGKEYRYIVDFSKIQDPEEVDPLGNPYPNTLGKHESTVELFTCVPPGTTKYRLSVIGKLVK